MTLGTLRSLESFVFKVLVFGVFRVSGVSKGSLNQLSSKKVWFVEILILHLIYL